MPGEFDMGYVNALMKVGADCSGYRGKKLKYDVSCSEHTRVLVGRAVRR